MHPPEDVVPPYSGPPEHVSSWAHVGDTACATLSTRSVFGDCVLQPTSATTTRPTQRASCHPHVFIGRPSSRIATECAVLLRLETVKR
jgi:hypothetical protein